MSVIFILLLLFVAVMGIYDYVIPDHFSVFSGDEMPKYFLLSIEENSSAISAVSASVDDDSRIVTSCEARANLLGIIPLKKVAVNYYDNIRLYPGGMPFGVKFYTQGVLVVGFTEVENGGLKFSPAYDSGLRVKDVIISVGGRDVNTVDEIITLIEKSEGKELDIGYKRDNSVYHTSLIPKYSDADGRYKAGMWIRDSTAGIGTVTFINPENNAFAGLGHGICDIDTGELMPLMKGTVTDVVINGLVKGKAGDPGELKGYFSSEKTGTLIGNTEAGVYGLFLQRPDSIPEEALPIALRNEVREGKAYIWCTLENGTAKKYEIEITDINRNSNSVTKSFVVKITDPALLELSGGIIQGMSGSPIIQNGKIVGAVTHVLINDPATGYGIFIENMLINMPEILR